VSGFKTGCSLSQISGAVCFLRNVVKDRGSVKDSVVSSNFFALCRTADDAKNGFGVASIGIIA